MAFQNRFGGGFKKFGTPQAQQGDGSNKTQWNISVKFGKYNDKGELVIKVGSMYANDKFIINKKYGDIFRVFEKIAPGQKYGQIMFIISPDKFDDFKKALPNIISDLKSTGHYGDTALATFQESILDAVEDTPTPEQLKKNKEHVISNWKELLTHLHDPEVRKKFLLFQATAYCSGLYSGATLSPSNIIEVQMADPMATFVTSKKYWRTGFNRIVQPGSPNITITKVEDTMPARNLMETDPIIRDFGGFDKFVKRFGYRSQEMYYAKSRVRKRYDLKPSFYEDVVYDVRFTKPMDPSNDKFLAMAGVINNLTGELNDAAKKVEREIAIERGVEIPDFDKKKNPVETPEELVKYKDFVLKKCAAKKINAPDFGNVEDTIANAVYEYALNAANEFNFLNGPGKGKFAAAVLFAIADHFNVQSSRVNGAINLLDNLTDEEQDKICQASYECYRTLANFSRLYEDASGVLTYDEYRDLFDKKFKKRRIVKEFKEFTERMNNLYKD